MKNDYENKNPDEKVFLSIILAKNLNKIIHWNHRELEECTNKCKTLSTVGISFNNKNNIFSVKGDEEYSNPPIPSLLLNRKECIELKEFLEELLKND